MSASLTHSIKTNKIIKIKNPCKSVKIAKRKNDKTHSFLTACRGRVVYGGGGGVTKRDALRITRF